MIQSYLCNPNPKPSLKENELSGRSSMQLMSSPSYLSFQTCSILNKALDWLPHKNLFSGVLTQKKVVLPEIGKPPQKN